MSSIHTFLGILLWLALLAGLALQYNVISSPTWTNWTAYGHSEVLPTKEECETFFNYAEVTCIPSFSQPTHEIYKSN